MVNQEASKYLETLLCLYTLKRCVFRYRLKTENDSDGAVCYTSPKDEKEVFAMTLRHAAVLCRRALTFLVVLMLPVCFHAMPVFADASDDMEAAAKPTEMTTSKGRACYDTSRHKVLSVPVARGVHVEVLDWGGSGDPLVFLAGLGNSAHIFDEFAYQFTDKFRVIGITRRGYGQSSRPKQGPEPNTGYDITTRAADDIKVLDHFKFQKAIFVGHSVAGVELGRLGAVYPDRVIKLAFLDAYDYGPLHEKIPTDIPGPPGQARDLYSPQHLDAYTVRNMGYRGVAADTCNVFNINGAGNVLANKTTREIGDAVIKGSGLADFASITAPTLGIFTYPQATPPYYYFLTAEQQKTFDDAMALLAVWKDDVIDRFSAGIKDVQVVKIPNAPHYIFRSNEAEVVHLLRTFLLGG